MGLKQSKDLKKRLKMMEQQHAAQAREIEGLRQRIQNEAADQARQAKVELRSKREEMKQMESLMALLTSTIGTFKQRDLDLPPAYSEMKAEGATNQEEPEEEDVGPMWNPYASMSDEYKSEEYKPQRRYYSMTSMPRGQCLIINNVDYGGHGDPRYGSHQDSGVLQGVFEELGFVVHVEEDLTAAVMRSALATCSERCKPSGKEEYDCVVVIVLAHGSQAGIMGVDGRFVKLEEIWTPFLKNSHLNEKPKVFLIQACRGENKETTGTLRTDATAFNLAQNLPTHSDIFIGYATIPGCVAYRDVEAGSPYAMAIASIFQQCSAIPNMDINTMLTMVNMTVSDELGFSQMPCIEHTLRKQLTFFME